jgi:hypothetical protein
MNTVVKDRRLTAAHRRLKRMEDLLRPYEDDVSTRPTTTRKRWVPSELPAVSGHRPGKRLK